MSSPIDHTKEFVSEMRDMVSERFKPDIIRVNVNCDLCLDDPTFLTKVKLRFKCVFCENKWMTYQGTVKCKLFVEF